MPVKSFLSFLGFVLLLIATYCPLLKPFGLISMDLYDMNRPFGITILLVAVLGITGIVLKQLPLVRLCAWLSLILAILLYIAAIFKVHHTFSFIPINAVSQFLSRQIRFKWGWVLIFAGPIMAILGIFTNKKNFSAS